MCWKGVERKEVRVQPLKGIKVIEMAGLAPSPYCGMVLADFGADVVVVDRLSKDQPEIPNVMIGKNPFDRGKRSVRVNLKTEAGIKLLKRMIQNFDVLIEPYRPGIMEGLGVGPDEALSLNPGLIYSRVTGWGQKGCYAGMAGHDINYIGISGALSLFRRKGERPLPPCNLLGDFAGGGMLCAMGILLALFQREKSGEGQIVDAAMVDGAAYLATMFYWMWANDLMSLEIGTNMMDGGAPYYQAYETADGKFMAVGAIEGRFYSELIRGLDVDPSSLPSQNDIDRWPEITAQFARIFKTRTREQWTEIFKGKDACVSPVLGLDEVAENAHNRERDLIINVEGVPQPAPAPRLSKTPGKITKPGYPRGSNTREVIQELGYSAEEVEAFFAKRIVE
jgi:alpha-methylacyl-CoA racemase